tara:strand:+ start:1403 stop:1615 length:213 start_codon:yes stop_codon:yes gene_type:complete
MDNYVRGLKLHIKRKAQDQRIKNAIDNCFNRLDYMLSKEGRQEFAEKEILLKKQKAFDVRGYVKSIYGRR